MRVAILNLNNETRDVLYNTMVSNTFICIPEVTRSLSIRESLY